MNILILTSGGDAPGMNAALRAVTRSALNQGHKVFSTQEGFKGLISGVFKPLNLRSVANIVHRGGTVLKTSRCDEFRTEEGRRMARSALQKQGINCIVGLGGDGTISGLRVFNKEYSDVQTIGIPCTIDNDYIFSENTIGFATAVNTAVDAIDKIRDTAGSHQRTFVVEVMGRKSTQLAYAVSIAAGAELVVDLSECGSLKACVSRVSESIKKGKLSSLIVTLEKDDEDISAAATVQKEIKSKLQIDCKSLVLGHIQRGGSPMAFDRLLASQMGYEASLSIGKESGVVVEQKGQVLFLKYENLVEVSKDIQKDRKILETLAN
jgi:6-phosphofructokinase 1